MQLTIVSEDAVPLAMAWISFWNVDKPNLIMDVVILSSALTWMIGRNVDSASIVLSLDSFEISKFFDAMTLSITFETKAFASISIKVSVSRYISSIVLAIALK